MKLLFLDHCARPSGAEIALVRLLDALRADPGEQEITVILAEDGPLREQLAAAGATVELLPMRERSRDLRRSAVVAGRELLVGSLDTLTYSWALAARIRHLAPDLVITNSLKAALYGGVAGRLAGKPVLWHLHDRIAEDYLPATAVRMVRAAIRVLPSAVVVNSRATLETLRLPSRTAERLHAATVGYALPRRLLDQPPRDAGSVPGSPLTVGMVGRLAEWKGQHVFLRAFHEAFPAGDQRAVLVGGALFGEEGYRAELEALVAELGLEGRVRFTGHVDDPEREMRDFDILVHASVSPEPFGQVIVEGMAMGIPVVASQAGGAAEIVSPEETGLLSPPGDPSALADRLARLAGDGDLRRRLAQAGRQAAAAYAPERIAAQMLDLYREAASGRRVRRWGIPRS